MGRYLGRRSGNARTRIALPLLVGATAFCAACSSVPPESIASSSAATSFGNDEPAYDFFVGKGLTNFQAAGIVGNLDEESGLDPSAVESGGPGRGIAQWPVGGRWDTTPDDNVVAYAAEQNESATSLTLQLEFIWYELQTYPDYGLAALRASTDVTAATVAFETDFEGCGSCDEASRVSYAEDVLAAYGSADAGGGGPTGDAAAGDAAIASTDAGQEDATMGRIVEPATTGGGESDAACAVARRPARGASRWWGLGLAVVAIAVGRRRRSLE